MTVLAEDGKQRFGAIPPLAQKQRRAKEGAPTLCKGTQSET